jgi:hypothetical protein
MVQQKQHRLILTRLMAAELGADKIRVNTGKPRCCNMLIRIFGQVVGLTVERKLMELLLKNCLLIMQNVLY